MLITGAAGLVGSRLVSRCVQEGLAVRALDRQPVDVAGHCRLVTRWSRGVAISAARRRGASWGYSPRVSYEEAMAETKRHLADLGMIKG